MPVPDGTREATFTDLQETLSNAIPYIISGAFNPAGSEHQLDASVADIVGKVSNAIKSRRGSLAESAKKEGKEAAKKEEAPAVAPVDPDAGLGAAPDANLISGSSQISGSRIFESARTSASRFRRLF